MLMGLKKLHIASSLQIIKIATKIEAVLNLRNDPASEGVLERSFGQFFPMIGGLFGTEIALDKPVTSRIRTRNEGLFKEDLTCNERSVSLVFH